MAFELKGGKGFGRTLYCLHPCIARLRTHGTAPMTIAKGVVVVIGPERAKFSRPLNKQNSSVTYSMAPYAKLELPAATNLVTSSHVQDDSTNMEFSIRP